MAGSGNRADRRRAKALRRRGKIAPPSTPPFTPIPLFASEGNASNVSIVFNGGSVIYPEGTGHPLAGAKMTGGPGGGAYRVAPSSSAPALVFQPLPHTGSIYLYLEEESFADTWTNGGSIPLSPAATYRSDLRNGVMTPDEVKQFDEDVNDPAAFGLFKEYFMDTAGTKAGEITNIKLELPDSSKSIISGSFDDYEEHAYLFCAAHELSFDIMRKFENKVCVVEIEDTCRLKNVLDRLMTQNSYGGRVGYTDGPKRGHFLKSSADEWQAEYRLAWIRNGKDKVWVDIPAGLAKRVAAP